MEDEKDLLLYQKFCERHLEIIKNPDISDVFIDFRMILYEKIFIDLNWRSYRERMNRAIAQILAFLEDRTHIKKVTLRGPLFQCDRLLKLLSFLERNPNIEVLAADILQSPFDWETNKFLFSFLETSPLVICSGGSSGILSFEINYLIRNAENYRQRKTTLFDLLWKQLK